MDPHSSTLAWKTPWTEEPGKLQSMGLQRVGYDWMTSLSLFTFIHWRRKWQPIPISLPGESHGQRSLAAYSPWGHKNSTWLNNYTTTTENYFLKGTSLYSQDYHLKHFLTRFKNYWSPVLKLAECESFSFYILLYIYLIIRRWIIFCVLNDLYFPPVYICCKSMLFVPFTIHM